MSTVGGGLVDLFRCIEELWEQNDTAEHYSIWAYELSGGANVVYAPVNTSSASDDGFGHVRLGLGANLNSSTTNGFNNDSTYSGSVVNFTVGGSATQLNDLDNGTVVPGVNSGSTVTEILRTTKTLGYHVGVGFKVPTINAVSNSIFSMDREMSEFNTMTSGGSNHQTNQTEWVRWCRRAILAGYIDRKVGRFQSLIAIDRRDVPNADLFPLMLHRLVVEKGDPLGDMRRVVANVTSSNNGTVTISDADYARIFNYIKVSDYSENLDLNILATAFSADYIADLETVVRNAKIHSSSGLVPPFVWFVYYLRGYIQDTLDIGNALNPKMKTDPLLGCKTSGVGYNGILHYLNQLMFKQGTAWTEQSVDLMHNNAANTTTSANDTILDSRLHVPQQLEEILAQEYGGVTSLDSIRPISSTSSSLGQRTGGPGTNAWDKINN